MKTKFTIANTLFLLFILIFNSSCNSSQIEGKKREVILIVNTDSITTGTIEKYAKFKGQQAGSSNKDFTIEADVKDKIKWIGKDTLNNRKVRIDWIRYESGAELFNRRNFGRGWFRSTIQNQITRGNGGDELKYKIEFSFKKKNEERQSFVIDPKIKIRLK